MTTVQSGWNGGAPWATHQATIAGKALATDGRVLVVFPRPEVWHDRGALAEAVPGAAQKLLAERPRGTSHRLPALLTFLGVERLCGSCRPTGYTWCTRCVSSPGACPACSTPSKCPSCAGAGQVRCRCLTDRSLSARLVLVGGTCFNRDLLLAACTTFGLGGEQDTVRLHVTARQVRLYADHWRAVIAAFQAGANERIGLPTFPEPEPRA